MTRPTSPRTPSLYHGGERRRALPGATATWCTLLAIATFYATAIVQRPGLLQLVSAQLMLGLTALASARLAGAPPAALGLVRPPRRALAGALLVGLSAWYPNLCLALWVQAQLGGPTRVAGLERLVAAPDFALTLLCLSLFPAVCEELAFRGLWARALAARFHPALAIAVTAPMFGAYHLSAAQLLPATLLGVVLAWTSLRAGSLWISILIHAANNATAILASRGYLGALGVAMNEHPIAALGLALLLTVTGLALIATSPRGHDGVGAGELERRDAPAA
jgi:membrane protease YdiL (CAAX protease family)